MQNIIKCPLCGENQPTVLYGMVKDMATGGASLIGDKGYSFCNCHNIFYTDKKNLDNTIYGDEYESKYDGVEELYKPYFRFIEPVPNGTFAEVGPVNDVIMDEAIAKGYSRAYCFHIGKRNTKHYQYVGDFEKVKSIDLLTKFDYIFMSHVFEHFVHPMDTAIEIGKLLKKNGKLFIAMPDPAQIDWDRPYDWQHLWIREHYILWDMESFIDFIEKHADVKCIYKERNYFTGSIVTGDYRLVFQKL
jgi:SAM-dependent methyltransferase